MVSYRHVYAVGNIQAGGFDKIWMPRKIRGASRYPVILLHGANNSGVSTAFELAAPGWPTFNKLAHLLASQGIPVVEGFMGGNNYANDAVAGPSGYVNAALTYVAAKTGCSSSKAHVIGASMGSGVGTRWASLNPEKAASVTGFIPLVNINRVYAENPNLAGGASSFSAGIAAAWGLSIRHVTDAVISTSGTGKTMTSATAAFTSADIGRQVIRGYTQTGIPADTKIASINSATSVELTKTVGASASGQVVSIADPLPLASTGGADLPGVHAPRLNSNKIPSRFYYASDDPFILPADVTTLATAAGGQAINLGTGGHTNALVTKAEIHNGGTDWSDLIAWLKRNGA